MNGKKARHAKICELLRAELIETHERMAAALQRQDIEVSQSTLSKDLRELGVLRVPRADGGYRYCLPDAGTPRKDRAIFERELRDYVTAVDRAGNMTVIKTLSGHAQAVCEALDHMQWSEAMGTLAGENTIFVISRTSATARSLAQRVANMSNAGVPG